MCGIAGFVGSRPIVPRTVARMRAALRRRGPDAEHVALFDAMRNRTEGAATLGLVHTRLSIIDPRPEADQPMANESGDVWIVYNGEVYDWRHRRHARRRRLRVSHLLGHRAHPARLRALGMTAPVVARMFAFGIVDCRAGSSSPATAWG
jgi:asparagine synthetase B (glutamine-hydrolysing)